MAGSADGELAERGPKADRSNDRLTHERPLPVLLGMRVQFPPPPFIVL